MVWEHGQTWYRVLGECDPGSAQVPAVVLHGGPGMSHLSDVPIAELLHESGRTTVLYDQLGCGSSTHLPAAPAEFWTVDLFKRELSELLMHLGIADRYALVGQSWGGMLQLDYALDPRPGLVAMAVCDGLSSTALWIQEANRLRADLPADVQDVLDRHEAAGTTDSSAYQDAMTEFYRRHVCRVQPWPDLLTESLAQVAADPTVYATMWGPSEFHCTGSLGSWDITDELHRISVPTLFVSGRYDEATPLVVGTMHQRVPGSEWVLFEESSHTPQFEEPARFREVVSGFLTRFDRG